MKKIWVLADDRMGNVNQILGVAEALKTPFERKDIHYTKWVKLPNFIRASSLIGITDESAKNLIAPYPDVVLSAGRRSYPVALYIRKKSGNKTKIVHLMNPGRFGVKRATIIALPEHDRTPVYSKNVVRILGAPHRVTPERLAQERKKWESTFKKYPHPRLSVIVGGATKDKPFTADMAKDLVKQIIALKPGSILLTTSRRTPDHVINELKNGLTQCPIYFYQFGDKSENPYFGLLACADSIVVTGDSISMCTETCATGLPVSIFAPDEMIGNKHKKFIKSLFEKGFATPLGHKPKKPIAPLNPASDLAALIRAFDK